MKSAPQDRQRVLVFVFVFQTLVTPPPRCPNENWAQRRAVAPRSGPRPVGVPGSNVPPPPGPAGTPAGFRRGWNWFGAGFAGLGRPPLAPTAGPQPCRPIWDCVGRRMIILMSVLPKAVLLVDFYEIFFGFVMLPNTEIHVLTALPLLNGHVSVRTSFHE